jgi:hypothetical protein
MNARVFLLMLFTFAFMGVWDADRPAVKLAKAAKPDVPVAASQPEPVHHEPVQSEPVHHEHQVQLESHDDSAAVASAAVAQETLPLDVQTVLLLVASVPWESSVEVEVPKPAESVVEQTRSGVFERATDVVTDLITDMVNAQAMPVEVTFADEASEVEVTVVEETMAPVEAVHESEELPVAAETSATSESITLSQEAAEAFIPLPKNLAAGTWQVMTESGEFYRVTIDKSRADSAAMEDRAAVLEEESFSAITTDAGVRWCFIRAFASPQLPGTSRQASTEFFGPGAK